MDEKWLPYETLTLGGVKHSGWKGDLLFRFGFAPEKPGPGQPGKTPGDITLVQINPDGYREAVTSIGSRAALSSEAIRKAGGGISRWVIKNHADRAGIDIEPLATSGVPGALPALIEGLILGSYRFIRYKGENDRLKAHLDLLTHQDPGEINGEIERVSSLALAVNLAREWAHEPANVINPVSLAERVRVIAGECGLKCTILDERQLAEMGAGAILAVGQGSQSKPRLMVLEYGGQPGHESEDPVVLIGKTITFDTGGYSIKTVEGIRGMKYDKCGGLNVLFTLKAAADLKLATPLIGMIAAAENMISAESYRPDDILTSLSGKTIEVLSTDAEGRLVLADALTYAQRHFHPRAMIDLATLTGGVVVALGDVRAGVMSNNDQLADALFRAGESVYERLWRLPLDEEYFEQIRGDEADIKNSGGRNASAIIGGTFLQQFVTDGVPWAHIDIAGVSETEKEKPYCPKGATGFGVRLLIEYLNRLK